jgi:hypothetical protein
MGQTMTGNLWQAASGIEKKTAEVIRNRSVSRDQVFKSIKTLPQTGQFIMKNIWLELVLDRSMEKWRRLEAYKILLSRCLTYPCSLEYFTKEAIAPLGIDKSQMVDMTMAQLLPMEIEEKRKRGDLILMVNLPILTSIGPASVYFAVERSTNAVEQAQIHPETIENGDGA